jgi:dihydroxyacetone kinase DhaKLM complex PTS-EIIA-like component DhaM
MIALVVVSHSALLAEGVCELAAQAAHARCLGPRSIGHQDPGATSSYLLPKSAAEAWRV